MQVCVRFEEVFWSRDVDFFGRTAAPGGPGGGRGAFFLVWSLWRCTGRPALMALTAGDAALHFEVCAGSFA